MLLCLLVCWTVEASSNDAPQLSFMGRTLPNNSYVDQSLVGSNLTGIDCIQCLTDEHTCCSRGQGPDRGDWYFPNGSRLPFRDAPDAGAVFESRGDNAVYLCSRYLAVSGVFRCDIATTDGRRSIYLGLYGRGGKIITMRELNLCTCRSRTQVELSHRTNSGDLSQHTLRTYSKLRSHIDYSNHQGKLLIRYT